MTNDKPFIMYPVSKVNVRVGLNLKAFNVFLIKEFASGLLSTSADLVDVSWSVTTSNVAGHAGPVGAHPTIWSNAGHASSVVAPKSLPTALVVSCTGAWRCCVSVAPWNVAGAQPVPADQGPEWKRLIVCPVKLRNSAVCRIVLLYVCRLPPPAIIPQIIYESVM